MMAASAAGAAVPASTVGEFPIWGFLVPSSTTFAEIKSANEAGRNGRWYQSCLSCLYV